MPNQFRESTFLTDPISADALECPDCKHTFSSDLSQPHSSHLLSCPACGASREPLDFISSTIIEETLSLARKKMMNACGSEKCDD